MRVFLAGASGVIGRRLIPLLLRRTGFEVTGSTRSPETARELAKAGIVPAVLDVFDLPAVIAAMRQAAPEIVIHQLTDLPKEFDQEKLSAAGARNARIRTEGTRNLIAGAQAAGAKRLIVQSIAFAYRPGGEPHPETDPLDLDNPSRAVTARGVAAMEEMVLNAAGMAGIVLRYGMLYGPGTWHETGKPSPPALHVDAAAQAAVSAITRGAAGIYNIADDDGAVSIDKARQELGFDPGFGLT
jgi:nucleoside-diphosphate-sugar epimerase